jgi:hypothetical protein
MSAGNERRQSAPAIGAAGDATAGIAFVAVGQ